MEVLKLSGKLFPNADAYLPKINCPQNYLVKQGHEIRTINSIVDKGRVLNAKALLELPEDKEFIVEGNNGKGMIYLGPETTNSLVTLWLQHLDYD